VRGLLTRMPRTGTAFLAGMVALMGLPPFGLFTSEVMIFGAGFRGGRGASAALGLAILVAAFAGLLRATQTMCYGVPEREPAPEAAGWRAVLPIGLALALLVATGLAWPPGLAAALSRVAAIVER